LLLDGKAAKIDLYNDPRDRQEKDVTRIDIMCTHFVEAVEKHVYGWLWECPNNGEKCKYTHALPQGYVLNVKAIVADDYDKEDVLSIEE